MRALRLRAVATTRSPECRAAFAISAPNPRLAPVINQVFFIVLHSLRCFVLEGKLQMAGFVDLDDQGHAAFRTAPGKWFPRVFARYEISSFQIGVGTVFDDAATKLNLIIRIVEIDD